MATKIYEIDLKAINEIYPDAENSKPAMELVINTLRENYESLRIRIKQQAEYRKAINNANDPNIEIERTKSLANTPDADIDYPEWEGNIDTSYTIVEGKSYNDVVTVIATLTVTCPDEAVKLIEQTTITGTFSINPTNRLTGY